MLYGKMPTAAVAGAPGVSPGMTTEESIRGHIERQETREFRRNILPQAFETQTPGGPKYTDENLQVFYSMDMAKVQELGRTGNKLQKDALRNLINQREQDITDMIRGLTLTGTPKAIREAEKVEAMWINIQGNPNYQT
ncbi:MAG TPA: hypothetical protein ENI19_01025 [Candidatus Nealsonbacteria bacterium]|nr:hypothetical protein [Candidatus Nealsonbacteria bacterium]